MIVLFQFTWMWIAMFGLCCMYWWTANTKVKRIHVPSGKVHCKMLWDVSIIVWCCFELYIQPLFLTQDKTKWPTFCRWHFQLNFLELKSLWFELNVFDSIGLTGNMSQFAQIMTRRLKGDKPLSEQRMVYCTDACMPSAVSMSYKYSFPFEISRRLYQSLSNKPLNSIHNIWTLFSSAMLSDGCLESRVLIDWECETILMHTVIMLNTLRFGQNGRQFADSIFKYVYSD